MASDCRCRRPSRCWSCPSTCSAGSRASRASTGCAIGSTTRITRWSREAPKSTAEAVGAAAAAARRRLHLRCSLAPPPTVARPTAPTQPKPTGRAATRMRRSSRARRCARDDLRGSPRISPHRGSYRRVSAQGPARRNRKGLVRQEVQSSLEVFLARQQVDAPSASFRFLPSPC